MRLLTLAMAVGLLSCAALAWDRTDEVYDDSMDDDSTIDTLAHNDEDMYDKSLKQEQVVDGNLLEDDVKDEQGKQLSGEISGMLQDLENSKQMDEDAKHKRQQRKHDDELLDHNGLGMLGESGLNEQREAAATTVHAFDDYSRTQNMLHDTVELGESDDLQDLIKPHKKKKIESGGATTCTGNSCTGSSTIKPSPPPPPPPPAARV